MNSSLRATRLITALLLAFALAACGGSDNASSSSSTSSESSSSADSQAESSMMEDATEAEESASDSMAASDSESEPSMAGDAASDSAPAESASAASDSSDGMAGSDSAVTVTSDGVAQVTIGGTDQMQYTVKEFTVEAGQEVELTLVHQGSLPVNQMGHNVVILQSGEAYMAFGRQLTSGGNASLENDYLPDGMRDGLIAYTDLIGGGESTTIRFTAPDTPGEYPYLCSFPGHYPMMNGTMVVR